MTPAVCTAPAWHAAPENHGKQGPCGSDSLTESIPSRAIRFRPFWFDGATSSLCSLEGMLC